MPCSTTNDVDSHVLGRYELKKRLGKGAYGIVWRAFDKKTSDTIALKKIFDAFRNQTDAQRTFREIAFLSSLRNHPNIIKLYTVIKATNNKDIYLTFEFMDADLHNVIRKGSVLRSAHKQFIMYQLFNAVLFLHSADIIHRDLKPSNVLLDSDCNVKLCDFGLARSINEKKIKTSYSSNDKLTEYVATRWYRAPEILLGLHQYSKSVDMWSLGCILAEMLLGKALFPGSSTTNQLERIVASIPITGKSELGFIKNSTCLSIIEQASNNNRVKRSLEEILPASTDPYAFDLISKLIIFDPRRRHQISDAISHRYVKKFRKPSQEFIVTQPINPPLDDNVLLSVSEYRNKLYQMIQTKQLQLTQQPTYVNYPDKKNSEKIKKDIVVEDYISQPEEIKTSFVHSITPGMAEKRISSGKDFRKTAISPARTNILQTRINSYSASIETPNKLKPPNDVLLISSSSHNKEPIDFNNNNNNNQYQSQTILPISKGVYEKDFNFSIGDTGGNSSSNIASIINKKSSRIAEILFKKESNSDSQKPLRNRNEATRSYSNLLAAEVQNVAITKSTADLNGSRIPSGTSSVSHHIADIQNPRMYRLRKFANSAMSKDSLSRASTSVDINNNSTNNTSYISQKPLRYLGYKSRIKDFVTHNSSSSSHPGVSKTSFGQYNPSSASNSMTTMQNSCHQPVHKIAMPMTRYGLLLDRWNSGTRSSVELGSQGPKPVIVKRHVAINGPQNDLLTNKNILLKEATAPLLNNQRTTTSLGSYSFLYENSVAHKQSRISAIGSRNSPLNFLNLRPSTNHKYP